jgi:hypothetical protein
MPPVEPRPPADRLAQLRERGERLVGHFTDAVVASVEPCR